MKKHIKVSIFIFFIFFLAGCVEQKIYIKTDPPGAKVFYDYEYKGKTPVRFGFDWFWYHEFEIIKAGYKPIKKEIKITSPLYLKIPLDLICELLPFKITYTKTLYFKLEKDKTEDIF